MTGHRITDVQFTTLIFIVRGSFRPSCQN